MGHWGIHTVNFSRRTILADISQVTFAKRGMTGHKDGDNGAGEKSSARERRRVA
jgi:hypothetical protein